MPPTDKIQQDAAAKFREIVSAAAELVRALSANCATVDVLAETLDAATANDGVLSLLMEKMDPKGRR